MPIAGSRSGDCDKKHTVRRIAASSIQALQPRHDDKLLVERI